MTPPALHSSSPLICTCTYLTELHLHPHLTELHMYLQHTTCPPLVTLPSLPGLTMPIDTATLYPRFETFAAFIAWRNPYPPDTTADEKSSANQVFKRVKDEAGWKKLRERALANRDASPATRAVRLPVTQPQRPNAVVATVVPATATPASRRLSDNTVIRTASNAAAIAAADAVGQRLQQHQNQSVFSYPSLLVPPSVDSIGSAPATSVSLEVVDDYNSDRPLPSIDAAFKPHSEFVLTGKRAPTRPRSPSPARSRSPSPPARPLPSIPEPDPSCTNCADAQARMEQAMRVSVGAVEKLDEAKETIRKLELIVQQLNEKLSDTQVDLQRAEARCKELLRAPTPPPTPSPAAVEQADESDLNSPRSSPPQLSSPKKRAAPESERNANSPARRTFTVKAAPESKQVQKVKAARPLTGIAVQSHLNARSIEPYPFLQPGTPETTAALKYYTANNVAPKALQSLAYNCFRTFRGRLEFAIKQRELGNISISATPANVNAFQQALRTLYLAKLPDKPRRLLLSHTSHPPHLQGLKQFFRDGTWPEGLEWDDNLEKVELKECINSKESRSARFEHKKKMQQISDAKAGAKHQREKRNRELSQKAKYQTLSSKRVRREESDNKSVPPSDKEDEDEQDEDEQDEQQEDEQQSEEEKEAEVVRPFMHLLGQEDW